MISSKALSALSWLTAAVAALALGTMAYIPARQIAQNYRVNVARAQTVAVQHATSTAITANSTIQATIIAAYPEATAMNVNAQGIPASEAQPVEVDPIVAGEIPVTYAPITILPPRSTAASVDGVVTLGAYPRIEIAPSATVLPTTTSEPTITPVAVELKVEPSVEVVEIVPLPEPTQTIAPTPTLERVPTPQMSDTPRPTDAPEPTITPVPVVVVTDTQEPTIEPSATATSVLQSPIATPTREATATP